MGRVEGVELVLEGAEVGLAHKEELVQMEEGLAHEEERLVLEGAEVGLVLEEVGLAHKEELVQMQEGLAHEEEGLVLGVELALEEGMESVPKGVEEFLPQALIRRQAPGWLQKSLPVVLKEVPLLEVQTAPLETFLSWLLQ